MIGNQPFAEHAVAEHAAGVFPALLRTAVIGHHTVENGVWGRLVSDESQQRLVRLTEAQYALLRKADGATTLQDISSSTAVNPASLATFYGGFADRGILEWRTRPGDSSPNDVSRTKAWRAVAGWTIIVMALALGGFYLAHWPQITAELSRRIPGLTEILLAALFVLGRGIVHEAGHAAAVRLCGGRVRRFGWKWTGRSLYLYMSSSNLGLLPSRAGVTMVALAGVIVDLVVTAPILVVWTQNPAQPVLTLILYIGGINVLTNLCVFPTLDGSAALSGILGTREPFSVATGLRRANGSPHRFSGGLWRTSVIAMAAVASAATLVIVLAVTIRQSGIDLFAVGAMVAMMLLSWGASLGKSTKTTEKAGL